MALDELQTFLGWCTVLHFGVLLLWWLMLTLGKEWVLGIHQQLTGLSRDELMKLHFSIMGTYKVAVYLLSLVPYLALLIMR